MTEDVTPLISPTMNLSKKRNVKRTSERVVSSIMRRLPSMRLLRSAESPLLRIVIFPEMKFAPLNMSLSAGPSKKSMMLRMMLLNAQLSRMRSVLMRPQVIPPSPSVPSGPEKSVLLKRRLSRSTLPSLDVPRNPERCVPQQAVDSLKVRNSVMTKPRPLSRTPPRKNVALSPREPVPMLPNLYPSLSLLMSVLMYPRRCVPGQEPTQERSRSLLSRSGVMSLLKSLDLLKHEDQSIENLSVA